MNEEKNLIIVYNNETEKYANFLKALLTQDDDTEEKIIGVKDGTVDVVVHSYEEYKQNKISIGRDNYILFIGNDKNIKNETEFIKIKGKYGLKYGWIGKIGWEVYKNNNKNNEVIKQQYICLILTFYFELINQFIGE